MRQPLDGARLKIVRAQEHLDAFQVESEAFLQTKPYVFESEIYGDHWWLKPRLLQEPPIRLSAIVGDVVTNIRASLDYIIWELANRYFVPAIDIEAFEDRSILTFPMLLASPKRRKGHINHLYSLQKRGIPATAIDIIKNLQADVTGDESLRRLYDLVNTDKHRTPILAISVVHQVQIGIDNYLGKAWLIRSQDFQFLNDGVALKAPPALLEGIRSKAVDVDLQMAVAVTCGNPPMPRAPLAETLTDIVKFVADAIPRFEPFLA